MMNNLIEELFDKSKTYRMGILCTYSLNIEFLENYLINLDGLANCNNLCIFTDRDMYNRQFENNILRRSKWINKRYLLTPIDTKGVFHPKIYILASDKSVRIGIGSANLTREGLATNLEIASVFEITKKDKTYLGLLIECVRFLKEIAKASNSTSAIGCINDFVEYIDDFLGGHPEENVHLLHNLSESISSQVYELLKDKTVRRIDVISPFYDENLTALKWIRNSFANVENNIFIQQSKSNFPVTRCNQSIKNTNIYVYKSQERYIHGKALIFTTDTGVYILTGSANFTESALLNSKYNANIEASLWGMVDKEVANTLKKPNGYEPVLLKDIKDLDALPIQTENSVASEAIILDWLDEVLLVENQIQVALKNKKEYIPKTILLNGDRNKSFKYEEIIDITGIIKSEIVYAQVEGIDTSGVTVKSGKMWIINLNRDKESYSRRRYSVSDPSQLKEILKDIALNGTEEELIDYMLKFNIPLDLAGINIRNSGLRAMESQGNLFGQLMVQNGSLPKHPGMFDAFKHFLATNFNKLCSHYDNIQLNKLDNFFLIFGTMFSMIDFIDSLIISSYKKNPIKAEDWSLIRNYYDLLLHFCNDCLELLWRTDSLRTSFADCSDIIIKNDEQQILGSIKSLSDFINIRGYNYQLKECYATTRKICKHINTYINKSKILTVKGKIVEPLISSNGYRDTYIIMRNEIYKYACQLEQKLTL